MSNLSENTKKQNIDEKIERLEKQHANIERMVKEQLRKTDRMGKAIQLISEYDVREDIFLDKCSKSMPYITVNPVGSGGINYVFLINSRDRVMTKKMFGGYKGIQSEKELQLYFDLTQKYYGYNSRVSGKFIDIGGNIGTTSIMVKKTCPKLDVISYEPNRDNYRVFKANCALNDCDVTIILKGLGECVETSKLALSDENMGNHRIANAFTNDKNIEEIALSTFDAEVLDGLEDIRYIWIDVEGYEGHILAGMTESLNKSKFPIWMEFCPRMLTESGGLEKLYNLLPRFFTSYIDRHNPEKIVDINMLSKTTKELGLNGNATDIFLIR